jgi:two-component system phosphate regulon sensor histidine kinase PhoR
LDARLVSIWRTAIVPLMAARNWLERIPGSAWAAAALAVLLALLALATNGAATLLVALAMGIGLWAAREARRYTIAPTGGAVEPAGLERLAPLLEALPDPALLVDADGRIAASNAAARREWRFEARGQFLTTILRHPDLLEAAQASASEGVSRAVEFETTVGVERHTRCYSAPITWGALRAALLVFHDQTARISTERMRADFLANASHELRTPLASLTLLIETIAGPARDNAEERDRFLKMMQTQADRMRRLIDDLLSLSRIEMDEHIPPSDRADLCAVVRESVDTVSGVAAERGVQIRVGLPESPVMVVGERFQLAQVIQNLLDNAVKYTPAGGEVRIEAASAGDLADVSARSGKRWDEAARVALLAPPAPGNRSYAYVRIEDSGPGIQRRFLPRLGERFFRVERELGDERGGTGLGLAIVKHIMSRHRGGLLVESQPGRGAAFSIHIESAQGEG